MLYIILAIILFGLLIAIHEGGHFAMAKLCGVKVLEFSIGMGPVLWEKEGRETAYSLRLFPVGGFCAMEGEDEESSDPRAFNNAAGWKRLLILVGGPAFNFISGLLVLICLYAGVSTCVTPVIYEVSDQTDTVVQEGLQVGDKILSVNGHRLLLYSEFSYLLSRGGGETADLVILRDGEKIALDDLPLTVREIIREDGTTYNGYGLSFAVKETGITDRLALSLKESAHLVRLVWFGLEDLITGAVGLADLSGPIGIVTTMSEVGQSSATIAAAIQNLLYFSAFIAINLAVMNMLPIPALDGCRVLFLLLNGLLSVLFHRRIPTKYEGYVHFAGLVLLLGLMAVVAFSDIYKLVN